MNPEKSKKYIGILMCLFVFVSLPLSGLKAQDEEFIFTEEEFDLFLNEVEEEIDLKDDKQEHDSEVEISIFDRLKALAFQLIQQVGWSKEKLKQETEVVLEGLESLDERAHVEAVVHEDDNYVSLHYYMKVPEEVANELGIDENYELYEIRVGGPFAFLRNLFNNEDKEEPNQDES